MDVGSLYKPTATVNRMFERYEKTHSFAALSPSELARGSQEPGPGSDSLTPTIIDYVLNPIGTILMQVASLELDRYPLVSGAATALPIDSHAVDVVVLPHVLEFEPCPHDALREASRVLVPEGSLLVLGFNPVSVIGLKRVLKHRAADAPWCGTYFSAGRLRDWLTLLGFDIVDQRPCFASGSGTPAERPGVRTYAEWMPPALASARLVLAKKRVNAMLPVRARWKPKRRLAGVGLAGSSVRAAGSE